MLLPLVTSCLLRSVLRLVRFFLLSRVLLIDVPKCERYVGALCLDPSFYIIQECPAYDDVDQALFISSRKHVLNHQSILFFGFKIFAPH